MPNTGNQGMLRSPASPDLNDREALTGQIRTEETRRRRRRRAAAATKIAAMQRGKAARKEAQERRLQKETPDWLSDAAKHLAKTAPTAEPASAADKNEYIVTGETLSGRTVECNCREKGATGGNKKSRKSKKRRRFTKRRRSTKRRKPTKKRPIKKMIKKRTIKRRR